MALSKISEIGGVIQGDYATEQIITALADGTALAGWCVGLTAAGVAVGTDTDGVDEFVGILLPHYAIDIDTLITGAKVVEVVIPQSGHLYGIFCADLNSSSMGLHLKFGADAGKLALEADIANSVHCCRTISYTDGDTVAVVAWGV